LQRVGNLRPFVSQVEKSLEHNIWHTIEIHRGKVGGIEGKLESLSPLSILQRGYSITREIPSLQILRDTTLSKEGDKVEVKLYRGTLFCAVERIERP
jgi:exodeoxyribonuclease VII large subunit